ncbi:unnamed protein product [Nesidiocoris tenuis]|uniref:C2H2-type domain-containing protein n=1 Tax=Nesidiocoris tenuis TaxID=355587 RepID=A0A6H5FZZ8_9HEMI|nr:unnamed protein product [Nesidiocoris tenuis]
MSDDFVNKLDAKLRDLEEGHMKKNNRKKGMNGGLLDHRPMFITTVKTGIFLDPPPELAALLGYPRPSNASSTSTTSHKSSEGLMYSYSSQPRVVNTSKVSVSRQRQPPPPKVNNSEKQQQNNQSRPNARAKRDLSLKTVCDKSIFATMSRMLNEREVSTPVIVKCLTRSQLLPVPILSTPIREYLLTKFKHLCSGLESQAARQAEARRRAMARRKAQTTRARNLRLRMGTPPPVEGRKHEDIQTEEYLEELFVHPPTETVFTQTDYFTDRPPTPEFVPAKTGVDTSTQIQPGELFHFDTEVKPILEVLVGKTVEQALVEVMEEEELAAIREQQRKYKEIRDAELAEQYRLEEEEKRKRMEMCIARWARKKRNSAGRAKSPKKSFQNSANSKAKSPKRAKNSAKRKSAKGKLKKTRPKRSKWIRPPNPPNWPQGEIDQMVSISLKNCNMLNDFNEIVQKEEQIDFFELPRHISGLLLPYDEYKIPTCSKQRICHSYSSPKLTCPAARRRTTFRPRRSHRPFLRPLRPSSEPPQNSAFRPYYHYLPPGSDSPSLTETTSSYSQPALPSFCDRDVFLQRQAAEIETLVSNLGQSKQGHLCLYCGKIYSRKYGLKIHIR